MKKYEREQFKDDNLQEAFVGDFKTFDNEKIRPTNQTYVRKIRIILRKYGIWTKKDRGINVANALYKTLQEVEPTRWKK